ncbi:MAG: flagellar basal body rod protein FlgC [Candidatus Lambdaproteobacteria bacterium]|nr:flagellar basal body rod protein FlgC [Candidatus Lambdaproteobacteria bacterium]
MNFLTAMETSSSGLAAQRFRMNVIAANIANAQTTRTPEGGPYRRRDVVFGALPAPRTFEEELRSRVTPEQPLHVKVLGVTVDRRPPVLKFDPSHPDANEEGFVAMPNINATEEMVNLMLATRSYEANVAAFNATKSMALKALDIGKV